MPFFERASRRPDDDEDAATTVPVRMTSAIIEGTEDEAHAAHEAIERALCPDPDHPGYCTVPWTPVPTRFDDLGPNERMAWQADFDADRRTGSAPLGGALLLRVRGARPGRGTAVISSASSAR